MAEPARAMYGGEAVFDGVMMRGMTAWSLACRLPSGEIHVVVHPLPSWMTKSRRIPILRGVISLAASVILGTRALQDSMSVREPGRKSASLAERLLSVAGALAIVGVFLAVPVYVAQVFFRHNSFGFSVVEALCRLLLLLGYLLLLSRSSEVRRVFEYHGAEHQTIAAREAGAELVAPNVATFSRRHPRCGSAFLLLIVVIGTLAHVLVGVHSTGVLLLSRVVLLPLVAGVTYEVLRLTSNHLHSWWGRFLAFPGLTLQRLTTRPATVDQIEVAIAALDAVVTADDLASRSSPATA